MIEILNYLNKGEVLIDAKEEFGGKSFLKNEICNVVFSWFMDSHLYPLSLSLSLSLDIYICNKRLIFDKIYANSTLKK